MRCKPSKRMNFCRCWYTEQPSTRLQTTPNTIANKTLVTPTPMAKTHGPPIVSKNFAKGVMHWGKMYPDLQLYQQPTAEPPGHFLADPSLVLPGVQNCWARQKIFLHKKNGATKNIFNQNKKREFHNFIKNGGTNNAEKNVNMSTCQYVPCVPCVQRNTCNNTWNASIETVLNMMHTLTASCLGRQEIPFCFVRAEFFTLQTGQDWQAEVELLV